MEICTVGSVRGESVGLAMVDLNGHEAGNGGYSQGTPTADQPLSYPERCPITALTIFAAIHRPLSFAVFALALRRTKITGITAPIEFAYCLISAAGASLGAGTRS